MVKNDELDNMLETDPIKRYKYFLNCVIDSTGVWLLRVDGVEFSHEVLGGKAVPVWPKREYAELCGNAWGQGAPSEVSLDELLEVRLKALEGQGVLIEILPSPTSSGFLVDISRFMRDVRMELDLIT
jgi:hypothetical protein